MTLPISILTVKLRSYHFHCSPKRLQPCLILVFKAAADVHLCSMPILISCKTYGDLYIYTVKVVFFKGPAGTSQILVMSLVKLPLKDT